MLHKPPLDSKDNPKQKFDEKKEIIFLDQLISNLKKQRDMLEELNKIIRKYTLLYNEINERWQITWQLANIEFQHSLFLLAQSGLPLNPEIYVQQCLYVQNIAEAKFVADTQAKVNQLKILFKKHTKTKLELYGVIKDFEIASKSDQLPPPATNELTPEDMKLDFSQLQLPEATPSVKGIGLFEQHPQKTEAATEKQPEEPPKKKACTDNFFSTNMSACDSPYPSPAEGAHLAEVVQAALDAVWPQRSAPKQKK